MSRSRHLRVWGLVVAIVAAACSTANDTTTENPVDDGGITGAVTVWGWEAPLSALEAAEAEFSAAHPEVDVDFVVKSPAETYADLAAAAAGDREAPDVVVIEDARVAEFVELEALADITTQVAPWNGAFDDHRWPALTVDARYHAMPWDSGPVALYYRDDVFATAGIDMTTVHTWAEFEAAARTVGATTGAAIWPQSATANDAQLFEMLLWQRGLGYVDAGGNVVIDREPGVRETLEFLGRLWDEGLVADIAPWSDRWYEALADGSVAALPGAAWMAHFLRRDAAGGGGAWRVAKLPAWSPGGGRASSNGGSALAIVASSEDFDAAWAFVEFHTTTPSLQLELFRRSDLFPALEAARAEPAFDVEDPYFGGQMITSVFADTVDEIPRAGIYTEDYAVMNALMADHIASYLAGEATAEEALRAAAGAMRAATGRA